MKTAIVALGLLIPSLAWAQSSDSAPPPTAPPKVTGFQYPPEALAACAEGKAIADIKIGADGIPEEVRIVQSTRNDALDAATKADWLKSRWKPATQNGTPVEAWKRMALNWKLNEKCVPARSTSAEAGTH